MKSTVTTSRSLSRRSFLKRSGQLSVGGLSLALGSRALLGAPSGASPASAAGGARDVRLEAREVDWELASGKVVKAMAYNGQIPGPELRLKEGERVRIFLKNRLREPTTIHWHGVDVPNPMDGVPGVTQKPVQPGETFVYDFVARPAGTRWYHTHFSEHTQLDLGLYAPLIIEPARSEPQPFDREYTLVLDDWATGAGSAVARTTEGTAGGRAGMGGMMGMMRGMGSGTTGGMMDGMMGRGGMGGMMGGAMGRDARGHAYDVMTINGKAYPATAPLKVRKGERLRLRLINASADHTHVVRLAGHRLQVTHTDGNPLAQAAEVDAIPIAPSERYDALLVADRPGAWLLACAQPGHAEAGEQLLVLYEGHEAETPMAPEGRVSEASLWHYELGRGRDVLPPATGQTRTFELMLSGGMMGSDLWTINGRRYPDTDPLRLKKGDRARVVITNMSMEAHPMHLHGQSFRLLAVNGRRLPAPIVKDSADVEPHMGSVELEFTAHNPGDWFFHCHKPMHMEGGMVVLAKIA
ncbi:MAG: multicopper oxidase family protein [Candidatus Rokuibacteriota bacterium]